MRFRKSADYLNGTHSQNFVVKMSSYCDVLFVLVYIELNMFHEKSGMWKVSLWMVCSTCHSIIYITKSYDIIQSIFMSFVISYMRK